MIETTNAVVLGGDIELTDAEYDLGKPYTDETIACILDLAKTEERTRLIRRLMSMNLKWLMRLTLLMSM